jgi:hypothetical protein
MISASRPDRESSDMTHEIELPPLPAWHLASKERYGTGYDDADMRTYARAAVLADREASKYPMAGDTERLLEIGELRRENERLRGELVQMEKAHREDLREAAAEARHRERFPDEPAGTW